jgi:hypothetical protein
LHYRPSPLPLLARHPAGLSPCRCFSPPPLPFPGPAQADGAALPLSKPPARRAGRAPRQGSRSSGGHEAAVGPAQRPGPAGRLCLPHCLSDFQVNLSCQPQRLPLHFDAAGLGSRIVIIQCQLEVLGPSRHWQGRGPALPVRTQMSAAKLGDRDTESAADVTKANLNLFRIKEQTDTSEVQNTGGAWCGTAFRPNIPCVFKFEREHGNWNIL